MKIKVEKGRILSASCHWIHFTLRNTDIMTTLNRAPLNLTAIDKHHFYGSIFKVRIRLKVIGDSEPKPSGEVDIVADVRMPCLLGRTHTVAHYRYRLVETRMTAVELLFDLETNGILMAIYAMMMKNNIDSYLNRVMADNERAALLMQEDDSSLKSLLTEEQLNRINRFRLKYGNTFSIDGGNRKDKNAFKTIQQSIIKEKRRLWDSELTELTELYETFEGRAENLESELYRIRETRDAVAALLIARRMLEVIVSHVCKKSLERDRGTEPLAGIIDKIARSKCAPEYVTTSMNNLNRLSTYGAHPKEFSPRQVREALMALCSIMEWYSKYCQ